MCAQVFVALFLCPLRGEGFCALYCPSVLQLVLLGTECVLFELGTL